MKRNPLPDLLKGFAVFLIVPVHILELFIDQPGRESLFGEILLFLGGPVAVPIFMMVMGYFVAKSQRPIATNLLRGVKIFVVGLLLNIGLNFNLLLKIRYEGWQFNPLEYVFGVDILYLAGLSVLFLALLKWIRKGQAWIPIVLAFFIVGLTGYLNEVFTVPEGNYVLPFIAGNYSWAYFPLFPWLAYPLIGYAFSHWEDRIGWFIRNQKIVAGLILAGISALVIWFGRWGIDTTIDLPSYYHHTFWFSLWAIGVVVLWVVFLRFLLNQFPDTHIGDFLKWLGKNITLFYVIQWLIIGNISTVIFQTQNLDRYLFWFGGIFSVTVFLTWLIGKTDVKLAR